MKFSKVCLERAFRCDSGPVLFLAGVCITVGSLFLRVGSGAGWIFLVAAGGTFLAFCLLGARSGCNGERGIQRP